ncbi:MAG TPA: PfkB family carbohydrate kinase [Solirubrobacteraceae bacterium]|nr:PfkB family carbohydrate kinase [Solirubrobacteraceae bacterium]
MSAGPRLGVVGHVEWVDFAVVPRLPVAGEIVHAREHLALPGGGGAVAAVQGRRLAGAALFLTAVGSDGLGERARAELAGTYGVDVHAAVRDRPQRRAFTHLDDRAERTITVLGERIVPHGGDPLPWELLAGCAAVYFTGGDPEALRAARAARVLVATPRALDTLVAAGVQLDVLVASASDPGEHVPPGAIDPPPRHVVLTQGAAGGHWTAADGATGRWAAAAPPGPPVDAYGCGDSFAIGLTYALGEGRPLDEALELGARCGAHCLAGRGPYGAELPRVE